MSFLAYLLMAVLFLLAVFLIVLVLVQRGKGGGLAGAFGGMGGQSAFGTKAGDLFTRVTIGVAAAWIILCIISVKLLSSSGELVNVGPGTSGQQQSQATEGQPQGTAPGPASGTSGGPAKTQPAGGGAPAAPANPSPAPK